MILKGNLFSTKLEMETEISILFSSKFDRNKEFKVIYLLHGMCGDSNNWIDYTMLPIYANNYNAVFIMPSIVRSFCANMKYGQKYFSYITEELPEICKNMFNIHTKKENTIIMGNSMGGYSALKCALSKPELYGYCCAFSSACLFMKEDLENHPTTESFQRDYGEQLLRDFQAILGENLQWNPENEILSLAKKITSSTKPTIFCSCGTDDAMRISNQQFASYMKDLGFNFTYEEWSGNHDFYFWNEALKKSLEKIFQ